MVKLCNYVPMFIVLACLVCFAKPVNTMQEDYVPRVVNGSPAKIGDFPYQLALKRPNGTRGSYSAYCGAAIIGPSKILSAGHCLANYKEGVFEMCFSRKKVRLKLDAVFAVAGTLKSRGWYQEDSQGTEQWRKLRTGTVPTNYNFPDNDIGIAFTKKPFVFNNYVAPVPYATRHRDYGDMTCTVSGYGMVKKGVNSDILLWADLALIPMPLCSKIHSQNMDRFICTSSLVSSVLKGDSGSPLVCRNTGDPSEDRRGVVVGVVSGLRQNAGTFFTRLSAFRDFVTNENKAARHLTRGYLGVLLCIRTLVVLLLFYYSVCFRIQILATKSNDEIGNRRMRGAGAVLAASVGGDHISSSGRLST